MRAAFRKFLARDHFVSNLPERSAPLDGVHNIFCHALTPDRCNESVSLPARSCIKSFGSPYFGVIFYQRTQRPAHSGSWCTYVQKMAILWLWLHPPGQERAARAVRGAPADRPVVRHRAPLAVSSCTRHSKQQRRRRPKRCTSPPLKSRRGRPRARRAQGLFSPAQGNGIRARACAQRARCVLAQDKRRQAR